MEKEPPESLCNREDRDCCDDCISLRDLRRLLKSLRGIEEILCLLRNPAYGLEEMKEEIAVIEDATTSPTWGLAEIQKEVAQALAILEGLDVTGITTALTAILGLLNSPDFGLGEIKSEVEAVESEVINPAHGLAQIKAGVDEILAGQAGQATTLASGPVLVGSGAGSLLVTVKNNSSSAQNVVISALQLEPTFANFPGSPKTVYVPAAGATTVVFAIPAGLLSYEVRAAYPFADSVAVFSATRTQNESATLVGSNLLPENTIRNGEFRPFSLIVP